MNEFVELRQVLRILSRRWWVLLVGVLIAGAIGYWISLMQTPVYAANTTVYVGRTIKSSDLERIDIQLGEQLVLTYADLVRRKPVLRGTVDTLQLKSTWQDLRERVNVSPVENTQLLEIGVKANSPEEAQKTADEIARQLILLGPKASQGSKAEETRVFAEERLDLLQTNIETAQAKLDELETKMTQLVSTSVDQAPALQAQIQTLEQLISGWDSTYASLLTFLNKESATNQLSIVESAEINPTPVLPRVGLNTLVAGVVGLILAGILILLLEFGDETLKPTDAVSEIMDVVTLGTISQIRGKTIQDKLIFRQDLFSPASEDYRLLRNKLQMMSADWPRKVLMVTSPTPSETRSLTVANLGVVLAQAGLRVIVVDANLRQPVQHLLFKLPIRRGLTDLLYGTTLEIDGELHSTEVKNLYVLPVGGMQPPHPSELLGSERMGDLLDQLAKRADIVLCESAQAVAIADALVLSSHVDAVLLVIEMGKTRRSTAQQAANNLRQAGANLLGTVLNPLPSDTLAMTKLKTTTVPSTASSHV